MRDTNDAGSASRARFPQARSEPSQNDGVFVRNGSDAKSGSTRQVEVMTLRRDRELRGMLSISGNPESQIH